MQIAKLILAVLAALWTLGVIVGFVQNLGSVAGTRGLTELVAGIGVIAGCTAVTIWLFQSALKKKPSQPPSR